MGDRSGGGGHFAVQSHFVAFAETKTNKRKLAMITSEGSMFGKPFCLVNVEVIDLKNTFFCLCTWK